MTITLPQPHPGVPHVHRNGSCCQVRVDGRYHFRSTNHAHLAREFGGPQFRAAVSTMAAKANVPLDGRSAMKIELAADAGPEPLIDELRRLKLTRIPAVKRAVAAERKRLFQAREHAAELQLAALRTATAHPRRFVVDCDGVVCLEVTADKAT